MRFDNCKYLKKMWNLFDHIYTRILGFSVVGFSSVKKRTCFYNN